MSLRRSYWVLALGIAAAAGCGSVQNQGQLNARATQALAQAQKGGAEKDAPYEYTKAAQYLQQARDDESRSDNQGALVWGHRSEDCSRKAILRAKQRRTSSAELPPDYSKCGP